MARQWVRFGIGVPPLRDVSARDSHLWMVATDGTLWTHIVGAGALTEQVVSPVPLTRVAVGRRAVWCVGNNGALWSRWPNHWTKATPHRASDGGAFELSAIDVAADSTLAWVVQDKGGGTGWFWSTFDGDRFTFGDALGFKRISTGEIFSEDISYVWLVDMLDRLVGFTQTAGDVQPGFDTNGRQIADVAGFRGDVWVVGLDGSVWQSSDRGSSFLKTGDGFVAITADQDVWALKADGTLWRWFEVP